MVVEVEVKILQGFAGSPEQEEVEKERGEGAAKVRPALGLSPHYIGGEGVPWGAPKAS